MKRLVLLGTVFLMGFNAFQSSVAPIPSGVTFKDIDGGPTYYGDNWFTNATQHPSVAHPFNGVSYPFGWDDPKFFPTGWWLERLNNSTDAATIVGLGTNTMFNTCCFVAGQMDLMLNNGISNVVPYPYWGQIISTDREPGVETVGINTFDEPSSYQMGWVQQIQGYPAVTYQANTTSSALNLTGSPSGGPALVSPGGTTQIAGTVPFLSSTHITPSSTFFPSCWAGGNSAGANGSLFCISPGGVPVFTTSETVTQAAVAGLNAARADGRFAWVNFTNAWIANASMNSVASSTIMSMVVNAPSGKARHIDTAGLDWYWFTTANQPDNPPNNQGTSICVYQSGTCAGVFTTDQGARGTHYGDMADIHRSYMPSGARTPIINFLETSNGKSGTPYEPQPVELNWAVWAMIIHGARGVPYFGQPDGNSPSGCNVDTPYCSYMGTAQTSTMATGASISGTTLTVANNPTGSAQGGLGFLAPGMQATAGVTGSSTILQQLTRPANATITAYTFSGTNNVTLTVTGVTGTIVPPATLTGTGLSGGSNLGQGINPMLRSQTSGTTGGNGVYVVDSNFGSPSGNITVIPAPGLQGTYKVTGGTTSGVSVSYQQWGWGGNGPNTALSTLGGITQISTLTASMAPVIKSKFAVGFMTAQSPDGYMYEKGLAQTCGQLQTVTCATTNGIDTMVKYYTGTPYVASTGDRIDQGFYIFATTRAGESSWTNPSVTITLCGTCNYTTAKVLGEGRTLPISAGSFTDAAFGNAWAVHIYQIK